MFAQENVVEGTIDVERKHHSHFTAKRAAVLRDIAEEYGGVSISMPREPESTRVTLKGAADCVEGAKQRIMEIVEGLDAMVTIECEIPQKHHRSVMGNGGNNVKDVTTRNNVLIKFPQRPQSNGNADENAENGEKAEDGEASPRSTSDIILITGTQENAEKAKEELLVSLCIELGDRATSIHVIQ